MYSFTAIVISLHLKKKNKKKKTEQAVKWNRGLPLLGVRIDFSILIWSIDQNRIQKIKKNLFSESRFNLLSKNRLKIDITKLVCIPNWVKNSSLSALCEQKTIATIPTSAPKSDICAVIQFLMLENVPRQEIHCHLCAVYKNTNTVMKSTINHWVKSFKEEWMSCGHFIL